MFNNPKLLLHSQQQLSYLVDQQVEEAMLVGDNQKVEQLALLVEFCGMLLARYLELCTQHPSAVVRMWAGHHLMLYHNMKYHHLWNSGVMLN